MPQASQSIRGVGNGQRICAPRQRVVLSYAQLNFVPNGTPLADQTWNMNSLFDPDRTGAGAQPAGFDQWAAFYNRYVVYKCAYEHTITNTTGGIGINISVLPVNGSTAPTIQEAMANSFGSFGALTNSGEPHHCRKVVDLAQFTGKSRAAYLADDQYSALTSASPAEILCMILRVQDQAGGTNFTGNVMTKLTFYAEFFDPIVLALS